jgi:hypothetical protein
MNAMHNKMQVAHDFGVRKVALAVENKPVN